MPRLRTERRLSAIALVLGASLAGAPVRADQILEERSSFTAADVGPSSLLMLVGLSKNGEVALVTRRTVPGCWAAYVFGRNGDTWTQQQKLVTPPATSLGCPGHVPGALSGDGQTAVLYDWLYRRAWVFVRSGTMWSLQQVLTVAGGLAGSSGEVALSNDGHTLLIGATGDDCVALKCGAAYVFVRTGSTWSLEQKLGKAEPDAEHFGSSVALSSDGGTALIGAYFTNDSHGAAYVYVRTGGSWSLQQTLLASDSVALDHFGLSVSLSDGGTTALVGAPGVDCTAGGFCGAAYVFVRDSSGWSQQKKLTVGADDNRGLGMATALSSDGNTALVGALEETCTSGQNCGSGYLFERTGSIWAQKQKLTPSPRAALDLFGGWVALSDDASTALVGARGRDCVAGPDCGTVHFFAEKQCIGRDGVINPGCFETPVFVSEHWVPVGCEIVDCCPGCPGPFIIDWHLRVDGAPVGGVIVRFDNLSPAAQSRLQLQGNAQWVDRQRLEIPGSGDVVIRGFRPADQQDLRWSTRSPRMTLERVVGPGFSQSASQSGRAGGDSGAIRVRVEQRVGGVSISHATLVFRYRR